MLEKKKKVGVFKVQEIIRVPLTGLHFMNSKLVGGPLNLKKKICQCIAIYTEFEMYFNRH